MARYADKSRNYYFMNHSTPLFSKTDIALCREASMSSMAIGVGLTHIRQYDFAQSGFFYSGLLSFTSGIERLTKLIVIYDYRLKNNNAFPTDGYLKDFGHKLERLISTARAINVNQSINEDDSFFDNDLLYQPLIALLTDFAIQARYYNLDYLTGRTQSGLEPLVRWDKEICGEIIRRHYKPDQGEVEFKEKLAEIMEPFTWVQFTREDGSEINSLRELIMYSDSTLTKQKYSTYYLYTIARFLCTLCSKLEWKGHFFPVLSDFFVLFRNPDKDFILEKKSWLPVPPYVDP